MLDLTYDTPKVRTIAGAKHDWELVIGMEVHAQVLSNAKLFSAASTKFGAEPNNNVAFVDAAMPGMLPTINEYCVEQAVRTGLGLKAEINLHSAFDRKNYFYPDLPQGYQISQLYHPIVGEGEVLVELGDTQFPRGSGSGGSWGASSVGSAVFVACQALRKSLAERAGVAEDQMKLKDGAVQNGASLVDLLDVEDLSEEGHYEPGDIDDDFVAASFGAYFTQVRVNHFTGETRVERMTGAFGFGRVLNETTARSQCLGGMTWSIGAALTEALHFDPVDGHLMNCDLAEYHVPVHRDVPDLQVIMVEERDPAASPIQAKGVGELGVCGGAGAIANAIYNACGARVMEFPMTPDKVLARMPDD